MNLHNRFLHIFLTTSKEIMVGGQAVIEGVMMRSPTSLSIAVRRADGSIAVKNRFLIMLSKKHPFLGWPIIRGVVTLIQSLVLGAQALHYSAQVAIEDIEGEEEKESGEVGKVALTVTMLAAMGFGILLFIVLPLFLASLVKNNYPILENSIVYNTVDGLFRIVIFLAYITGISFIKDIKRVFQYHGAEHKAIFCYEAKEALTAENAQKFSRLHPRCGTNFLIIVMFVSIFCFTFLPAKLVFYKKILSRFIFIPLIGGVSYELIRYGGKNPDSKLSKIINFGLLLQKITTKEPSKDHLEIAIRALKDALKMEGIGRC